MVSIAGLDKAEVLAALHAASHSQGMGFLHDRGALSVDECREILKSGEETFYGGNDRLYFDYLRGRVMKVDLSGDEFDPFLFDRDNFPGAAEKAIAALRSKVAA